jgi:predicted nucleic acid-binding protein
MQSIVADTTPLNYLVLHPSSRYSSRAVSNGFDPSRCGGRAGSCKHSRRRAHVDFAPSCIVGSCEPEEPVDSSLEHLDAGEREAISLASELQAILLLMDERDGVAIARLRGLKVVGTLAALDLAAAHGLVDLQTMFDRLRATTFRSPVRLMVSMLEQDAAQETSRRPIIAQRVDNPRSGYNKGTIRSDIWYLVVSKDVRRHRLISIDYITALPCHGRGRGFESRRPRHSFHVQSGKIH